MADSTPGIDYKVQDTAFGKIRKPPPFSEKNLIQENIELRKKSGEYKLQAEIDKMTQLARREELPKFLEEKIGKDGNGIILFLDIDHFKEVNDTYGHSVGDMTLNILGKRLKAQFPETKGDFACRVGGEEFVVVLENGSINIEGATKRADDFRKIMEQNDIKITKEDMVREMGVAIDEDLRFNKTVSIGIAERMPGQSYGEWIKNADEAMYKAKQEGRNRVAIAEQRNNA